MTTGTKPVAEKRPFYDWAVNTIASLVTLAIWYGLSWGAVRTGLIESQDRCFMLIVAAAVAIHLHRVKS